MNNSVESQSNSSGKTSPENALKKIIELKQADVKELYVEHGFEELFEIAKNHSFSPRGFSDAIKTPGLSLIAEVKKASPSKGVIRKDFNPVEIAKEFERYEASALSVLTEEHFFLGSPDYLTQISETVKTPLLRKDFLINPIQVAEARLMNASAILLIAHLLTKDEARVMISTAKELGLDVLYEIHSEAELDLIPEDEHPHIIGINNRDLTTFTVDTNTSEKLLPVIRSRFPGIPVVAESGYFTVEDLEKLQELGFDAVLIGEGLAKNPSLLAFFGKKSEHRQHEN